MAGEAADSFINAHAGRSYWEGIPADVNGMLGGISSVSRADLRGSRAFLAKLGIGRSSGLRTVTRALEGGAGIGRITQGLLLDVADVVDLVEPIARFTQPLQGHQGVGQIFNSGLEEWEPDNTYDLVWNQWCVGHLTDDQLVKYLQRCRSSLREHGLIVVKENICTGDKDLYDEVDSSVTRLDEKFRRIFDDAGLKIVRTELQNAFPKELFPVRMYGLQPQ